MSFDDDDSVDEDDSDEVAATGAGAGEEAGGQWRRLSSEICLVSRWGLGKGGFSLLVGLREGCVYSFGGVEGRLC